ncbi:MULTISPECIES: hypothetical protein [unclassified Shewanella]|uniref:hypothetical protein n=1 Tax=unclassified Shewanella TaxID=196818 RepID=UPI001BBA4849|nr:MULTISPECIES: hypothetical protein [unclassified Shewanella]GIU11295.1 hypothetical protein TUM4444_16960 [Shewanella sp. MBTL60-112-B1]GIU30992.1 hypothetical protein TUM4445_14940 [Shewanella sp. MBTL60-112-B2]
MKKLILTGLTLSLTMGLTACASTEKNEDVEVTTLAPESVDLGGLSNEDATTKLLEALLSKSYMASRAGPNGVAVNFDNNQFILQPSINPDGIDRIMMNRFYAIHPKYVGSKEMLFMIGTLNQKLNFAKFVVRDQGAVIQVQGAATFVDTISMEEIRRFILWTDEGLRQVGQSLPEGAEDVIKPIPVMQNIQAI